MDVGVLSMILVLVRVERGFIYCSSRNFLKKCVLSAKNGIKRQLILVEIADSTSEDKKCKDELGTFCHTRNQGSYHILLESCQSDLGTRLKRLPMDP